MATASTILDDLGVDCRASETPLWCLLLPEGLDGMHELALLALRRETLRLLALRALLHVWLLLKALVKEGPLLQLAATAAELWPCIRG